MNALKITPKLANETGRDYALRTLEYNITHLCLEPGSKISENELAQQMGLSRTPVREALIELSKVDIVQIIPQKGSMISLIDPRMVEQAYFMRSTLECEAVQMAVDRMTRTDLLGLENCLLEQRLYCGQEAGLSHTTSFMTLDNRFHALIFDIAGMPMVFRIIQGLAIHFDRIRHMTIDYMSPPEILAQHQAILDAMKEKDKVKTLERTRVHLGEFRRIEADLRVKYPTYFIDSGQE